MKRKATAVWEGALKDGSGTLSTTSGVLNETSYSFSKRFEDEPGTNPEELVAAAHAGCFAMYLSNVLDQAGMKADRLEATATVTLQTGGDSGPTVTASHLDLVATIPGADEATFLEAANTAKEKCPISKLLNAEVTLSAKLSS